MRNPASAARFPRRGGGPPLPLYLLDLIELGLNFKFQLLPGAARDLVFDARRSSGRALQDVWFSIGFIRFRDMVNQHVIYTEKPNAFPMILDAIF